MLEDGASVYVIWQVEEEGEPKVHFPVVGLKNPVVLLVERVTVPDGEFPVAVTVHVANAATSTGSGPHITFNTVVVF